MQPSSCSLPPLAAAADLPQARAASDPGASGLTALIRQTRIEALVNDADD